jgi:hypothetical protein
MRFTRKQIKILEQMNAKLDYIIYLAVSINETLTKTRAGTSK